MERWAKTFWRHLREWRAVLRENGGGLTARMLWRMALSVRHGWVSRSEWRRRARVCGKCPLKDAELRRCAGPWVKGRPTGCGCYLPFLLRAKRPYAKGCWGRTYVGGDFGWK